MVMTPMENPKVKKMKVEIEMPIGLIKAFRYLASQRIQG